MNKIPANIESGFEPISLEMLNGVSLLKRHDSKFVLSQTALVQFLSRIKSEYKILEINGVRRMPYRTLYFDTKNKSYYLDHHNGLSNRYKVRIREYMSSQLSFLEVKRKDNKGNTDKKRIEIPRWVSELTQTQIQFVDSIIGEHRSIHPTLENGFYRMTLANLKAKERLTIDVELTYNGRCYFPDLCIIELKQASLNTNSLAFQTLKNLKVAPTGFSKYCVGMALVNEDLKQNNFKKKIRYIQKTLSK